MGIQKTYVGVNGQAKEAKAAYVGYNNKTVALPIIGGQQTRTMTAKFNLSDGNPATWGTYQDDAVGMMAGSSDWDTFFGHYPALVKNGAIVGELDPAEGYAKFTDGTSADITSGSAGDVMIVFPRRDIHIWKADGYGYVSMTDNIGATGFSHYAHTYKGSDCDWFGLGRYKGYYDNSSLRALSGKTPTANKTISAIRTYAQNNGTGYEQDAFFQFTYIQAMYMLKYLGQNAQTAIGRGYTDGNSAIHATGGTNALGMDYGEGTGKVQCSLFGIEDAWGNLWEFIDGLYSDSNRKLYVVDGNYNDTGSGYTDAQTSSFGSNVSGYTKDANWTDLAGFTISSSSYGSATTYFCDQGAIQASKVGILGGDYGGGDVDGLFCLWAQQNAGVTGNNRGSRLMFMHTA